MTHHLFELIASGGGADFGVVPIEKSVRGVEDIVRANDKAVTVLGRGGEKLDVPCRLDWLAD